jgi:RNA polymerase sigma factor (sigma-70 family)
MPEPADNALDELLVLDAQGGDAEAFNSLVKRWQPTMWRHARILSDDDASSWDAVQESWSAVVRGLNRLDDPAGFGAWVLRIVTNKCADAVRGRSRRRGLAERAEDLLQSRSTTERKDDDATVRAAVAMLPEALRAAVSLHYGCGLSVAQTGAVLAIPAGTVKSRLSEARQRLRVILERTEA